MNENSTKDLVVLGFILFIIPLGITQVAAVCCWIWAIMDWLLGLGEKDDPVRIQNETFEEDDDWMDMPQGEGIPFSTVPDTFPTEWESSETER